MEKMPKFSNGMETVLNDGDEIYILPAVAGGSEELSPKELDKFSRQVMLRRNWIWWTIKIKKCQSLCCWNRWPRTSYHF